MSALVARARLVRRRIVFSEGTDARVIEAAGRLAREGIVEPILIGKAPAGAPAGVRFEDPASASVRKYAEIFYERRRAKGITHTEAEAVARRPLYFAALMVTAGEADGTVGGAANTTAETVRAALYCIGPRAGTRLVSSCYIMALHNREVGHKGLLTLADCSVVIEPGAVDLAEIAIASAATTRALIDTEPTVALLSFSTKGSGSHAQVKKVVEAYRIVKERAPDLHIDGELQADAAISPLVGRSKAPGSTVAGYANTLVFPNLSAGNIAYKLLERLCGATAIGPFLQGLAKPANDLSRGCSAEDIYNLSVATALQV